MRIRALILQPLQLGIPDTSSMTSIDLIGRSNNVILDTLNVDLEFEGTIGLPLLSIIPIRDVLGIEARKI